MGEGWKAKVIFVAILIAFVLGIAALAIGFAKWWEGAGTYYV